MRKVVRFIGILLAAAGGAAVGFTQQPPTRVAIQVQETVGIRRFGYPVTVQLSLPAGAMREPFPARLATLDGKPIPAQLSATAKHLDGSVQTLEVDFNLSPGPLETTRLQFEYGERVTPSAPQQGLAFSESADAFQVSAYRVRKDGRPLISSVRYGREYLKQEGLGIIVWDGDVERRLHNAQLAWTIEKQGPFQVRLRGDGRLAADGADGAEPGLSFTIQLEFASTKSWVGLTHTVRRDAPSQRKVGLGVEGDFALAGRLLWDQDVGYWLYGVLESPEQMSFAQRRDEWLCRLGKPGQEMLYATSTPSHRRALGWGHFQEAREDGNVVAFGIGDFASPGERVLTLRGDGKMTLRFNSDESGDLRLRSFFHFVPVPAQHTARTSPAATTAPLEVTLGAG